MPPEMLATLPGYDPDIAKNRAEARKLMEKLGYGLATHLAVMVSTRNVAPYRDPAMILIDQLKEIYIDGDLNPLDTTQWYPTLMRKDYKVLNVTETAIDDPDPAFYENYVCGCAAQLYRLLQPRSRQAGRPAIGGDRRRKAQAAGVGDRAQPGAGRRPADPVLFGRGILPEARGQGVRGDGQQHLQRLALRGPLARPVTVTAGLTARTAAGR
jgi:hypothetical protein